MRVRFNAKMVSDLTAQQHNDPQARSLYEGMVMEAQGEPRPGRLNTKYLNSDGTYSYRTYAWRDLEVIA